MTAPMIGTLKLNISCAMCGRNSIVYARKDQYEAWQEGTLVHIAMPQLSVEERETLISSLCRGCQDLIFNEPLD